MTDRWPILSRLTQDHWHCLTVTGDCGQWQASVLKLFEERRWYADARESFESALDEMELRLSGATFCGERGEPVLHGCGLYLMEAD